MNKSKDEKMVKVTDKEEKLFGLEKLKVVCADVPAITHVDYSARIQTKLVTERHEFIWKKW